MREGWMFFLRGLTERSTKLMKMTLYPTGRLALLKKRTDKARIGHKKKKKKKKVNNNN